MPEGHTIHRLTKDHKKQFVGQTLKVLSPQGRFKDEAKVLNSTKLVDITCHGKHLFYHWSKKNIVHVHLGLYGKFRVHENPSPEPKGAVRIRLIGKEKTLDLNGPNCCELIEPAQQAEIRNRLGEDPLLYDAKPEIVWERIRNSRSAIGTLLLNQSVVAGIGNIYRAEILYLLGIHPNRLGNEISEDEFNEIWDLSVKLLKLGVKNNRIITNVDIQKNKVVQRRKTGKQVNIYKTSQCPKCEHEIRSWKLSNRNIFACENCQS